MIQKFIYKESLVPHMALLILDLQKSIYKKKIFIFFNKEKVGIH